MRLHRATHHQQITVAQEKLAGQPALERADRKWPTLAHRHDADDAVSWAANSIGVPCDRIVPVAVEVATNDWERPAVVVIEELGQFLEPTKNAAGIRCLGKVCSLKARDQAGNVDDPLVHRTRCRLPVEFAFQLVVPSISAPEPRRLMIDPRAASQVNPPHGAEGSRHLGCSKGEQACLAATHPDTIDEHMFDVSRCVRPTYDHRVQTDGSAPNLHYPTQPIEPVEREVMRMWWDDLTFLHWPYELDEVQRLLPEGLTVDPWVDEAGHAAAWVGLVPFEMRVGFPGGRQMPARVGVFPETNVRTYVRGPDGTPGVWFCSLEAGALPATATARLTYGLPYFWADMRIDRGQPTTGSVWSYTSTRRWPKPKGARHRSLVRVGEAIAPEDVSPFEHYLTNRWGLFSRFPAMDSARGRNLYAPVDHGVWPLRRGTLLDLDDQLMTAAGLSAPVGDPVVHWTTGTEVRIGRPRRA